MNNESFLKYLSSWQFWFASVFIGILINLLSDWLGKKFGNFFSGLSKSYATRNEKLKAERNKHIAHLRENPLEQQFFLSFANNQLLKSIKLFLFTLINGLFAAYQHYAFLQNKNLIHEVVATGSGIVSVFCFIAAIKIGNRSEYWYRIALDARSKTLPDKTPDITTDK